MELSKYLERALLSVTVLLLPLVPARADDTDVKELRSRVEKLEKQNEQLRDALANGQLPAPDAAGGGTKQEPKTPALPDTILAPVMTAPQIIPDSPPPPLPALPPGAGMGGFPGPPVSTAEPGSLQELIQKSLTVKLRDGGILRPYGFFRGDLDLATARFNDIQNPLYVLPNDSRFKTGTGNVPITPNEFNYSLYPRLTRLGLEYYGQPIESCFNIVPSGRVETDFLTVNPNTAIGNNNLGINTESREVIRLRLAYAQLQMGEFTLLAGQDWDIIAPLNPTINDNTLMWNVGNMGDRRPQVKLLWDHDLGDGYRVQVQNGLALADAIDGNDRDVNGLRDNEATGIPGYEGRLGLVLPSRVRTQSITAGAWGLWADSESSIPIGGRTHFPTWAYGFDLRIPICEDLTFQGEFFHGQNIDDFRGGIGQGINTVTGAGIESTGGWAELVYHPISWYQVAAGFTMDNPVDGDIQAGGRTCNYAWYVSNRFPVGHGVMLGADYINWTTDWQGYNPGNASLVKFFMQVTF